MPKWFRRCISISASDSPNVSLGLYQRRAGLEASHKQLVPGILTLAEYDHRRATWSEIRATIGLDAQFYAGAEQLLFPPGWLDVCEARAKALEGQPRKAKAIGIDPAEGGDKTAMAAVDEWGLIELVSKKTPDTSVIPKEAKLFMERHGVDPSNVVFDRGGGGKQHADLMKSWGFRVRSIGFGETVSLEPRAGKRPVAERRETREDKIVYENRRAQLYWELSMLCDPGMVGQRVEGIVCQGFTIPAGVMGLKGDSTTELRHQLEPLPKLFGPMEKAYLPPKNRPKHSKETDEDKTPTICELIGGHSPDESDAVAVAVHGMLHRAHVAMAGAVK